MYNQVQMYMSLYTLQVVHVCLVNQTAFHADKVGRERERIMVWPNSPGF